MSHREGKNKNKRKEEVSRKKIQKKKKTKKTKRKKKIRKKKKSKEAHGNKIYLLCMLPLRTHVFAKTPLEPSCEAL